jgi:hypothetical protein
MTHPILRLRSLRNLAINLRSTIDVHFTCDLLICSDYLDELHLTGEFDFVNVSTSPSLSHSLASIGQQLTSLSLVNPFECPGDSSSSTSSLLPRSMPDLTTLAITVGKDLDFSWIYRYASLDKLTLHHSNQFSSHADRTAIDNLQSALVEYETLRDRNCTCTVCRESYAALSLHCVSGMETSPECDLELQKALYRFRSIGWDERKVRLTVILDWIKRHSIWSKMREMGVDFHMTIGDNVILVVGNDDGPRCIYDYEHEDEEDEEFYAISDDDDERVRPFADRVNAMLRNPPRRREDDELIAKLNYWYSCDHLDAPFPWSDHEAEGVEDDPAIEETVDYDEYHLVQDGLSLAQRSVDESNIYAKTKLKVVQRQDLDEGEESEIEEYVLERRLTQRLIDGFTLYGAEDTCEVDHNSEIDTLENYSADFETFSSIAEFDRVSNEPSEEESDSESTRGYIGDDDDGFEEDVIEELLDQWSDRDLDDPGTLEEYDLIGHRGWRKYGRRRVTNDGGLLSNHD